MNEKLIPCTLDLTKDCPKICPLRDFSEEVIEGAISLTNPQNPGLSLRESLQNGPREELVRFRIDALKNLQDLIPVKDCANYPKD